MIAYARSTWILLALCIAATCCVWYVVAHEEKDGLLTVSFLNVGQGDAIFIDAPSGRQMLIDGGQDGSALRELGRILPWYDRTIDVVVATHPDQDHIGGLIGVLSRYRVNTLVRSDAEGDTPSSAALWNAMRAEGAHTVFAKRGMFIELGTGVYAEILSPDRSVSALETNTGCIVVRLVYGDTAFLLPCDAPQAIERTLVRLDGAYLRANVLKAGHHGSNTSSAFVFTGFVGPEYVVYSRGCGNRYGHPHAETVDTFARFGVTVADTCTDGTVTFVSDGRHVDKK